MPSYFYCNGEWIEFKDEDMAKDFENKNVEPKAPGNVIIVQNLYRVIGQPSMYISIRLTMPDHSQIDGLWTTKEFNKFIKIGQDRAKKQPEDVPTDGIIKRIIRKIFR